ncbi:MAG: hypothetical protein KBS77_07730 [Bacteroidales bacterium]|nr:hypothetical protein [Candidatus Colicola faecequi]
MKTIEERASKYANKYACGGCIKEGSCDELTCKLREQKKAHYLNIAKELLEDHLTAFERFLDKYNLLQSYGHANAWKRFVKDMKGEDGLQ